MRGQKLFVRPIESGDREAIRTFLARNSTTTEPPLCGLIGKLVGELVAVMAVEFTPDAVRIDDLVVAKELRRKRIARVMLSEAAALAVKMDRQWLETSRNDATEFLARVGFTDGRRRAS